MSKHYDKEFKENAVRYALDHEEISIKKSAKNLGLSGSALVDWIRKAKNNNGEVPTRGSGNYSFKNRKTSLREKVKLY